MKRLITFRRTPPHKAYWEAVAKHNEIFTINNNCMTHKIIKKGILANPAISKEAKEVYSTIEMLGGYLLQANHLIAMGHRDYEKPLKELIDTKYVDEVK